MIYYQELLLLDNVMRGRLMNKLIKLLNFIGILLDLILFISLAPIFFIIFVVLGLRVLLGVLFKTQVKLSLRIKDII